MYYVYFLQSITRNDKIYIGYASDLKTRLEYHNKGLNTSTKSNRPWRLVFYEAYAHKDDARKREDMLKIYPKTLGGLKRRLQKSLKRY